MTGIDTRNIDAVCGEVNRIYGSVYTDARPDFIPRACGWFRTIFWGEYKTYQPLDVPYHDYEHTMQGFLCLARLLQGRYRAGAEPVVPRPLFELGMLAVLLHDTGYLRHETDTEGTGAKYTLIHVDRSRKFAEEFLLEQGFSPEEVKAVQNMIQCTAMDAKPDEIPFSSTTERIVGLGLATADLMGQMSADDYVERLPQLYGEFKESWEHFGEKAERLYFESADILIANTPDFWQFYVKPKLEAQCEDLYKYLSDPYPDGKNEYLSRIEANIRKAAQVAGQDTAGR